MTVRTAVVTGSARGIGAAIAAALRAADYRVFTVDVQDDSGVDGGVDHRRADLGDPDAVAAVGEWVRSSCARVDLLVNNAAVSQKLPLDAVASSGFDQMIAVNLRAPLLLIQQLRSHLAGGGSVVTMSSIRAVRGFPDDVVYQMTKGGVEAMTRALAVELAGDGIRVNAVAPGAIATEMNRAVRDDPGAHARATALIPVRRFGTAAEVADAVLYLACAGFVSGHTLTVDGAQSIAGSIHQPRTEREA